MNFLLQILPFFAVATLTTTFIRIVLNRSEVPKKVEVDPIEAEALRLAREEVEELDRTVSGKIHVEPTTERVKVLYESVLEKELKRRLTEPVLNPSEARYRVPLLVEMARRQVGTMSTGAK